MIPTNNVSRDTLSTVKSIDFDDLDYEILIVIDSLANISRQSFDKLKNLKTVRIIQSVGDKGISETLNHGIRNAKGEFILRIDDGDINLRKDLSKEFELLQRYDLVCAAMVTKAGEDNSVKFIKPRLIYRKGRLSPFSRVPHPTWIFKKNSIKFLYQSQDHRCEDFGFLVRNKFKIGYLNEAAVEYDVSSPLNYFSELKSAWSKWKICLHSYSFHWIMLECTTYVIIRFIRLTLSTKKLFQ